MADKKITDLPELTQADAGDFFPIVDSSANVTKKVQAQKIIPAAGGGTAGTLVTDASGNVSVGTKTVDANGWRAYNYGGWKMWTRQFPFGTSGDYTSGAYSLPVGVANIGAVAASISWQANGAWFAGSTAQVWMISPSPPSTSGTSMALSRSVIGGATAGEVIVTVTLTSL